MMALSRMTSTSARLPACRQTRPTSHRIIRFASQSLPASEGTSRAKKNNQDRGAVGEVKNTQYIELMKWMPPYLLQDKAISTRDSTLRVKDVFGINDWIIEFMSFAQLTQVGAGHQRWLSWLDELASENFLQEQVPRLIATKGDLIMSYTVTKEVNYLYDMMFSRATKIYRTQSVCDFFKNKKGVILPREEDVETPYKSRIAVFHASTYDNPTLDKDDIDEIMSLLYSDFYNEDVMNMRLYCVWQELTNLIFPNFNPRVHMIDAKQYFDNGQIPSNYFKYRSVDYHESVPWAILFYALSAYNEAFIWAEYTPDPKNNTTLIIAKEIARISEHHKFNLDLIDPLAAKIQVNTSRTVIDDLNDYFHTFKNENICEDAYFQSADTKNTRGRDKIRERLFNASLCKTPFNNEVKKDGITTYLPTLWVFKDCRMMGLSLQKWREEKGKPIQEFSHYCTALEFLEKDARVKAPPLYLQQKKEHKKIRYFQRA
jgi:hypothetical protein